MTSTINQRYCTINYWRCVAIIAQIYMDRTILCKISLFFLRGLLDFYICLSLFMYIKSLHLRVKHI